MKPLNCIIIELVNYCNYRCARCPFTFDTPRTPRNMTLDLYNGCLHQAYELTDYINFSFFGEQTLHPQFNNYMKILWDKPESVNIVLNTNMTKMTLVMADVLKHIPLAELRIKFDAISDKVYWLSTQKRKPISTIMDMAKRLHDMPDFPPIRHVYTVTTINVSEAKKYVKHWLPYLGPQDTIIVKPVLSYGGNVNDPYIQPHPCTIWDANQFIISSMGNVTPCNLDVKVRLIIGSVYKTLLKNMINNDKFKELKEKSLNKECKPCTTCIDSNNLTRNLVFKTGDVWDKKIDKLYNSYYDKNIAVWTGDWYYANREKNYREGVFDVQKL